MFSGNWSLLCLTIQHATLEPEGAREYPTTFRVPLHRGRALGRPLKRQRGVRCNWAASLANQSHVNGGWSGWRVQQIQRLFASMVDDGEPLLGMLIEMEVWLGT